MKNWPAQAELGRGTLVPSRAKEIAIGGGHPPLTARKTARANSASCSKVARSARSRLYELRIPNCPAHRSNGIRSCRHKGEGTQKSPQCWGWSSMWRVLHRPLAVLLRRLIHQFRSEVSLLRYVLEGSAPLEEISRSLN